MRGYEDMSIERIINPIAMQIKKKLERIHEKESAIILPATKPIPISKGTMDE
jgi:hypothetical protein